ncbi:MAG: CRISPR-associated protein Cas4 [Acidobacteria bacterium]|nr:CRISPR-associated protein Cas4 [Acidobacteriota bacterium]
MIELRVSDVRQWTFCPRILYHRELIGFAARETPKMAFGREAEALLAKLETRRTGKRYGLERARRYFGVPLESERLGLRGVCDLVLDVPTTEPTPGALASTPSAAAGAPAPIAASRLYPVDVKRTHGGASRHHAIQLAGYALLLEERDRLPEGAVATGFLCIVPSDEIVPVALDADLRESFLRALAAIREMLATERFPAPTRFRSYCPQCEYVNFCGDVL